jgi:hypothetical protein
MDIQSENYIDETTADVNEYNLPYIAVQDTVWSTNPASSRPPRTGEIKQAEVVYFNRTPSEIPATWQDAKIPDGTIKFVHPNHFRPVINQ